MKYIIAVEEWNYPCESGREVVETYSVSEDDGYYEGDERDMALEKARMMCEEERLNFAEVTKTDPLFPELYQESHEAGYIITPKNGLDAWYYAVRLMPVVSLDTPVRNRYVQVIRN